MIGRLIALPDDVWDWVSDKPALEDDLCLFVGLSDGGSLGEGRFHSGLGGEGGFVA